MLKSFIGRSKEIEILNNALNQAETEKGKLVLVEGDSGFGKSALVREFLKNLEQRTDVLIAATECNDIENLNAYAPFKDLILRLNSATTSDKKLSFSRIKKFVSEAGTSWIGLIPVIGGFAATGIDTYKAYKETYKDTINPKIEGLDDVFKIFENEFKRLAVEKTLVLFIDDLQWADASSLNLLFALSKAIKSQPFKILLIGAYRPLEVKAGRKKLSENNSIVTIRHPFADKLNELRNYLKKESHLNHNPNWLLEIKLQLFSLSETRELIDNRFAINTFDSTFYKNIYNLTDGLPLFVVETLDYLISNNRIQLEEEIYTATDISIDELPVSISGVISEKVDKLDESLKKVLTFASVNGKDFTLQVIEHISKIDEDDLFDYFDVLIQNHNLINEKDYENALGDVFAFSQTLTQQFVYKNMSRARRKSLHRKIAGYIKDNFNSDLEDNKEIRDAYNYHHQVGQGLVYIVEDEQEKTELPIDISINAAQAEIKNAKENFKQFSYPECLFCTEKAMAFVSAIDDSNLNKKEIIFDALRWQNLCQIQEGQFNKSLETALQLSDIALKYLSKHHIVEGYISLGGSYIALSEDDIAIEINQKALKLLSKTEDDDKNYRAEILSRLSYLYVDRGFLDKALVLLEETIELYLELEDVYGISQHYQTLGDLYLNKKEFDKALQNISKSLEIDKEMNDIFGMALNYFRLGIIYVNKEDKRLAIENFEKAKNIFIKTLNNTQLAKTYFQLAELSDELIKKTELYEEALKYFKKTDDILMTVSLMIEVAECYTSIEAFDLANNKCEEALKIINQYDKDENLYEIYISLNSVLSNIGNYQKSIYCLEQALPISEDIYGKNQAETGYIYFELAKSCYMSGSKELSEKYIQKTISFRERYYGKNSEEYKAIIDLYNDMY